MKKAFIFLSLFFSLTVNSQTTFRKATGSWLVIPYLGNNLAYQNATLIYNNRFYNVWNDYVISFPGLIQGKYDMNGNLLLPNLVRNMYLSTKPYKVVPSGNHVSIIGETGTAVNMVRRDTTNMNITISHSFFGGSNWLKINDAFALQNGHALIVGGIVLSTGPDTLGFFLRVDPATNSVIAQGTVAVNSSTNTQMLSATELSNGKIYVTGMSGGNGFIGRMTNVTNPQIVATRFFNQAKGKIRVLNGSKLICYNAKSFTRIDTNLALLSSASSSSINSVGQSRSFYMNNKLYSVGIFRNELSIIDSNITSVTSHTYNMPGAFFEPDLATIGNGIFITSLDTAYSNYVNGSNFHRKVNVLKLKNNGVSSCSSALNYSLIVTTVSTPSLITVNSATISNTGNITTSGNLVPNTLTANITCTSSAPPAPVNTTPSANQAICNNNSTVLTATANAVVKWYSSLTSSIVLYTGNSYTTPILTTGTYTYYTESVNVDTSLTRTPITVTVAVCSGIDNQKISINKLHVFPNPTQSKIIVVSNLINETALVINALGEVILRREITNGTAEINMEGFPDGVYFIKHGHLVHKVLKN
ncbi:MAG: T9SS type A sorting domain-containing protein [Sphingobacteriaceae bacterium]|nr:T9SS type A sorting domain-containing protein [Sphingobacteriaceae bacterium]